MVKINKIYTRTGDDGTTSLIGGKRTEKHSIRVATYGEIDELNSFIGWARTLADKLQLKDLVDKLSLIQNELFDLGAVLATPNDYQKALPCAIYQSQIDRMEQWIDGYTSSLPELKSFVLPGGNELNSLLHVARAVCRRAERQATLLASKEEVDRNGLIYLNRLSDLLFAMARTESFRANIPEYLWRPGGK